MPGRWSRGLLVVALSLSLGAHWAFLQSIAWAGMVVKYSQAAPFQEAIRMTFDGEHPCRLCHLVRAGQSEEQKPTVEIQVRKIDGAFLVQPLRCFRLVMELDRPPLWAEPMTRSQPPPTPPPELV